MRISDWSSDVCSSDLSVTARDSISSTGATKLTSRNSSSGATSAITHQRRGAGNLARDPGIESLRELVAILDPEIGIEFQRVGHVRRSEEHTSELQSLMRISYAVFCLKKKTKHTNKTHSNSQ